MSKSGPPRRPAALLTSWRAKERAETTPQVPPSVPACPAWLDEVAAEMWVELVGLLEQYGILTALDRGALEGYCETYSRWRAACAEVRKSGPWHTTQQGLCETPASRIAKVLTTELRQLGAELGLSPASRSGLDVKAPKPKRTDGLAAFTAG